MEKYQYIIRPCSDLVSINTIDGSGHIEKLEGDFLVCTKHNDFLLSSHYRSFQANDEDCTGDMDVVVELNFESDDEALAWLDWFDGMHLDPWRVDFVFTWDGREIYVR